MKTLPVDVLKIDKTFVEGLPEDCRGHYSDGAQPESHVIARAGVKRTEWL